MPQEYRIFGSELSPFSVKVRSYLRYKGLPHRWSARDGANMAEFQKHAKLPLIPLVLTPEGEALQDSTPIIEKLEARHPEPRLDPEDPALAFLSALLEEYSDEWGNKPMFHYRWCREVDEISTAERIAAENLPDAPPEQRAGVVTMVRDRMPKRLHFVGSSPETADFIEAAYLRVLDFLEVHLDGRPFVMGARPCLADLGLWCQLYESSTDPTPGALLRERAPRVRAWIERMLTPKGEGDFESWESLAPTLAPLLKSEVAGIFLPWSDANARALAAGEERFEVELRGERFAQNVQKYHARSLAAIRAKHAAVPAGSGLDAILEETGCAPWLAS